MCGICGTFSYGNPEPADEPLVRAMANRMSHRGPDDEGFYFDRSVGLGFRRLSIIDVEGGHQPIANEQGTVWVTFNGEIYNFRTLRTELEQRGHVFATRTDTEVIVHGYEEWGDDCVTHFNGMFGLAVWDAGRDRLLLARDHFGVKPLYYFDDGVRLSWASELKALLANPSIPREVDSEALDLFLSFRFVPSPFTMLRGVRKLAPGHRLVVERGGCRVERFWRPSLQLDESLSEADYIALLQERLEAAVRRQMMSDVPIGALLSGGLDSAAVVAIMSKYSNHPVRTFSVGFTDGGQLNELDDARKTASLFGTEHHGLALGSTDFVEGLAQAIWHLEEPISSVSPLLMYLVCRLAREHVKVVLTGQGADEPFCGYHRYLGERYGAAYRRLPALLRHHLIQPLVGSLPRRERLKRAVDCLDSDDPVERFTDVYAVFSRASRAKLWRSGQRPRAFEHLAPQIVGYWRQGVEHLDPLVQMSFIDARLSLSDDFLIYGDKMSMAASVEARVPFLDLEMMAAAEALPPASRIRGFQRKYIYRKVVAKWLPKEILARPKRGFDAPTDRWFRHELVDLLKRVLLSSSAACPVYFDPDQIQTLLQAHVAGRQDNRRQLYNLLVFELWHRQFISEEGPDGCHPCSVAQAGARSRWPVETQKSGDEKGQELAPLERALTPTGQR
jgi:asparagine synthase (glutamine-hydrolysing)